MDNTQNIISLCSGIGGLDLGVQLVLPASRVVAYVEGEAFCIHRLVTQMEAGFLDSAPVWTDVKTFDGRPFRGKVDGIIGGYPCQPFSQAGQRKGTNDPRHLWPDILRILQSVRPAWAFFENVRGHLRLGFPDVLRDLTSKDRIDRLRALGNGVVPVVAAKAFIDLMEKIGGLNEHRPI